MSCAFHLVRVPKQDFNQIDGVMSRFGLIFRCRPNGLSRQTCLLCAVTFIIKTEFLWNTKKS